MLTVVVDYGLRSEREKNGLRIPLYKECMRVECWHYVEVHRSDNISLCYFCSR